MRIFLAIDFPQEIKENLLVKINEFRKTYPAFRWIKKTGLHLTIKFIGEVSDDLVSEIQQQFKDAFLNFEPFSLITTHLDFFPSPKKARVFFLDLQESDALNRIYKIIEDKLAPLGIAKESRRFHPHITLARIKNMSLSGEESQALLNEGIPSMSVAVGEIVLMRSELLVEGTRYTAVQRFSLRTI